LTEIYGSRTGRGLGGETLLDHVIGTREPEYTTPYDINIIGEYNLAGEFWQVRPHHSTQVRLTSSRDVRATTKSRSRCSPIQIAFGPGGGSDLRAR